VFRLRGLRRPSPNAPGEVKVKPGKAVHGIMRSATDLFEPWSSAFDLPPVQWGEVISYTAAPDWFLSSVNTVMALSKLPPGWDSYGSEPVSGEASTQALRVLSLLSGQRSTTPHIGPVAGGGLQMEWTNDHRALELEVRPDGSVEFLRVYDDDRMEEGQIAPDRVDYLRQQVSWLYSA